jgi:hypothetical protein
MPLLCLAALDLRASDNAQGCKPPLERTNKKQVVTLPLKVHAARHIQPNPRFSHATKCRRLAHLSGAAAARASSNVRFCSSTLSYSFCTYDISMQRIVPAWKSSGHLQARVFRGGDSLLIFQLSRARLQQPASTLPHAVKNLRWCTLRALWLCCKSRSSVTTRWSPLAFAYSDGWEKTSNSDGSH